jgi:hypothetical protein
MECNRGKKNLSSRQIQPYLRLRRFIREKGGRLKYGGVTEHFDIAPQPSHVVDKGDLLEIGFPTKEDTTAPIFTETSTGRTWRYAFVKVPREAIFNDDPVQPRNIRYDHAFLIYGDLLRNPLHEPPSLRLGPADAEGLRPLLMFDGQHKTIATWMSGRSHVVVKLYLDMSADDANYLVNSIQAKIKKLPLSAFELSAKMSDEWRAKVEQYEDEMAQTNQKASEEGFLKKWIPAGAERNRAVAAFKAALVEQTLRKEDFRLLNFVRAHSDSAGSDLSETMVKAKVLDKMLHLKPLSDPFNESADRRQEETENIVWLVNQLVDGIVEPNGPGEPVSEQQLEARRRLFKQGSLQYLADLLGQVYRHLMVRGNEPMLDGRPAEQQRELIEQAVSNICRHPIWTAAFDRDKSTAAVKLALEKNQNVKEAFEGVALKLSYAIFGEQDIEYGKHWRN